MAAAALIIAACGRDAADPEAEIEATIDSARDLARAGDAPGLVAMIAPDYADDEGRNRRLMGLTLRALLGRYPRHLALVDDLEIRVISPELATARMTVSLVGRDGSRPLSRGLDADRVRLDLALRRAGADWLVTRASWGSRRQDIGPSGD